MTRLFTQYSFWQYSFWQSPFWRSLLFAFALTPASAAFAQPRQPDPYRLLLAQYIKSGIKKDIQANLVNYRAWGADPLHQKAIAKLLRAQPSRLTGKKKMAFWINAYNLLTIDLIVKHRERESIKNLGSWWQSPWKAHTWKIEGQNIHLDHIEHNILRPMGDPRIHMAINCASLSCPDLRAEPYHAQKLSQQLDQQTRSFLKNKAKGVRITQAGLIPSSIFKWFATDFGGKQGVIRFIRKYHPKISAQTSIKDYLDYDWSLNDEQ